MRKIVRKQNSGFTLAELLIVVAIIGVLVAISIPIFSNQLEKAREATDAANIRSQYAEVIAEALTSDGSVNGKDLYGAIQLQQKKNGWSNDGLKGNLEGVFTEVKGGEPKAGGTAWVEYNAKEEKSILHYDGGSGSGDSEAGNNGSDSSQSKPSTPVQPPKQEDKPDTHPSGNNDTKTNLPVALNASTTNWQTIKSENSNSGYTFVPGKIYQEGNNIYFGAKAEKVDAWSINNRTIDEFAGWYDVAKYTGKIWNQNDFNSQRSDLTRGDLCRIGNDYYAFVDGGSTSDGPLAQPSQWVKIIVE